ncbi:hypothetical protein [Streptomyces sp. NPDC006334]|uniref:hypothetical protein n=1 Tax=Streptomyces sp. NPDC006334 TaxID=3156754 RepID=UPI0033BBF8D3
MTKARNPFLDVVDFPAMPQTVVRPLAESVLSTPVSPVWRKGLVRSALNMLRRAGLELGFVASWIGRPVGGSIPAIGMNMTSEHKCDNVNIGRVAALDSST